MTVRSVNVGRPSRLTWDGATIETGIFKGPVGSAYLTSMGFRGDVQVDRKNHGGTDKAVCVYPETHLNHWSSVVGRSLRGGSFGENLTVSEADESDICIGDVFAVGGARVQVSQPRQPCHKLAKKMGIPTFAEQVITSGKTGFYFRVLIPGRIPLGDSVTRMARNSDVSVAFANDVMYKRQADEESLQTLLGVACLSDAWQRVLKTRLNSPSLGEQT